MDLEKGYLIFDMAEHYSEVNYFDRLEQWRLGEHDHPFYQCIFILEGIVHLTVQGETHTLRAGQFCIIPPRNRHALLTTTGYKQVGINLRSGNDSKGLIELVESSMPEFLIFDKPDVLEALPALMEESRTMTKLSRLKLSHILDGLLLSCAEQAIKGIPRDFKHELLAFLHTKVHQRLSLHEISHHLSISQSHLERLVNHEFGCGVIELFNQLRINKACILLRDSDSSIEHIAEQLGFYDTAHFSHFFKRRMQLSPTIYRKQHPASK
jgi:AraC-like DNA-binding protein